jgi:hypothetical protein
VLPTLSAELEINPLMPNDLKRRRAMSPLKIKIPSKKSVQATLRVGIYYVTAIGLTPVAAVQHIFTHKRCLIPALNG